MLDGGGESREDLIAKQADLDAETKALKRELATYSDNDPTELERKRAETEVFKKEANQLTDDIYGMEGWFTNNGQDEESMKALRFNLYGAELDEDGVLRELS